MAQTIESTMTTDPETVDADAALVDAAKLMDERDIGDVVVVDDGTVVGIVTDRDITVRGTARGAHPTETPVRDVMSADLVTVEPGRPVDEVLALMREHAVRRVPVVLDGEPVGIVSLGDLAVERDEGSVLGQISAADPND